MRVGIIELDPDFGPLLDRRFEAMAWEHRALPPSVGADQLVAMKLDVLVVDLFLLPAAGWEFLERVAGMVPSLAVIVCTDATTVAQRVRGLRLGADDWITKPVHPEELVARIEAVARRRRRSRGAVDRGPLVIGEVEVRPDQYQAFVGGSSLGLTRREFELLDALAERQGRVLERDDIYQRVWGYAMPHGDRSVDVFVRKLRAKLERTSPSWTYVHTHVGIGYRLQAEPAEGTLAAGRPGVEASEPASRR